jgi:hypothetical protein
MAHCSSASHNDILSNDLYFFSSGLLNESVAATVSERG